MSCAQAYFIGSRNKVLIKTRKQEAGSRNPRKQEATEPAQEKQNNRNEGSRKQMAAEPAQ